MGNPAFYLVEECGACSEPLYTGRQPPWSWWRDSFWLTRWVLVFLQFWEPKKSWFMAIHGTYFMFFWIQGNKFKTDLNWTSILTKCKHDSCSQISGFIPQSLFFMERMSQVVAVLGEISAMGTPRTSKAPMHQWSTKTRICYWIGLRVGIWVVHGWTRTMEHEDFWLTMSLNSLHHHSCLPFAAGMDETVSDCRSRRGGWSHQVSNWSAEPAANIGLESVMFDLFMRDDQDLGYQWVSCMFLCPSHHLSSLSTKNINQELQLFRGLTSSCSFWSHHFFDSAENFNISWAKGKFSEVVKYHSVSHQNFWDIWTFPTWRRWVFGIFSMPGRCSRNGASRRCFGLAPRISGGYLCHWVSITSTNNRDGGVAGNGSHLQEISLFFWGKCFAKIFWTNLRFFSANKKGKEDRPYTYHTNTRGRCLRFPECPTRPGHYKTIHDATCAADFALVWMTSPQRLIAFAHLNCFMILDV